MMCAHASPCHLCEPATGTLARASCQTPKCMDSNSAGNSPSAYQRPISILRDLVFPIMSVFWPSPTLLRSERQSPHTAPYRPPAS